MSAFVYALLETVMINGVLNSVTCYMILDVYTNSHSCIHTATFSIQLLVFSRHNSMWLAWRSPSLHNDIINAGHTSVVHKLKAFVYTLILSVQVLVILMKVREGPP